MVILSAILSVITSGAMAYFITDLAMKVDKRDTVIIFLLILIQWVLRSIIVVNSKGDPNVTENK